LAKIEDPTEYDESAPALVISDGRTDIDWSHTLRGNARHRSHLDPVESAK
jgi:hypothetical protein